MGSGEPSSGSASSLGFTWPPPLAVATDGGAARDGVLYWQAYPPQPTTLLGASSSSMLGTPPQPTTSPLVVPASVCREAAAAVEVVASTSLAATPMGTARLTLVDCHAGCRCCGSLGGCSAGGDCRPSAERWRGSVR